MIKTPGIEYENDYRLLVVLNSEMDAPTEQLRMERFTLFWITEDVTIPAGSKLKVGSGANIYGGARLPARTTNTCACVHSVSLINPEPYQEAVLDGYRRDDVIFVVEVDNPDSYLTLMDVVDSRAVSVLTVGSRDSVNMVID